MTQTDLFEVHASENLRSNEIILENNKDHFSKQCSLVYHALKRGERLTVRSAMIDYGIGDLRRRIKDLIDHNKINVKSCFLSDSKTKEFYL